MRHQSKRATAARHQSVCFVPCALVLSMMGALAVSQAQAQENNDRVFQLGKVVVQSSLDREAPLGESAVSQKEMQAFDLRDVGAAVSVQPGVTVSAGGARNEQMGYVRGFDSRQVPLFLDGIPQYVPYDGYVD
ncbi:Plug domain-containing protein, partial [Alcaligenes nematophilus]